MRRRRLRRADTRPPLLRRRRRRRRRPGLVSGRPDRSARLPPVQRRRSARLEHLGVVLNDPLDAGEDTETRIGCPRSWPVSDRFGSIFDRLISLSCRLASLRAGIASLSSRLASLRARLASLRAGRTGRGGSQHVRNHEGAAFSGRLGAAGALGGRVGRAAARLADRVRVGGRAVRGRAAGRLDVLLLRGAHRSLSQRLRPPAIESTAQHGESFTSSPKHPLYDPRFVTATRHGLSTDSDTARRRLASPRPGCRVARFSSPSSRSPRPPKTAHHS